MISSEDFKKALIFSREGLDTKILMDYETYEFYVQYHMR